MTESSPGANYSKLSWLQAWHIRDETYSAGLADLVNAQFRHPFAVNWGDGSTSSSDGQHFRAGGRAQSTGDINPKYGAEPGKMVYTHISDTYAPFSTKMVNVGARFDLCARRAALPRVGFAHRRALHGHGRHQQQFQASGKAINDKVRLYGRICPALFDARQSEGDPFAAIEAVISWDAFKASVTEAQKLAQPESLGYRKDSCVNE